MDVNITIFDQGKESYIIGDLLNMPYYFANWNNTPHHNSGMYDLFKKTALQYKNNILGIYDSLRKCDNEPIPNIDNIILSVDKYFTINFNKDHNLKALSDIWNDNDTLFVHLRSGDKGVVEDYFVYKIIELSKIYSKIIIMCGIHQNGERSVHFPNLEESKNNLIYSLNKIQNNCKITIDTCDPDTHLCVMRNCKNLLVHRGGFSMLGALLFNGDNLYITKLFYPLSHNSYNSKEFFEYIKNVKILD